MRRKKLARAERRTKREKFAHAVERAKMRLVCADQYREKSCAILKSEVAAHRTPSVQTYIAHGDRVIIRQKPGVLDAGARGKVIELVTRHGVTTAWVQLERYNSCGKHPVVIHEVSDLYPLDGSAMRPPRLDM